tara:strand:- start:3202 stop:4275 length:1074 start_codon:yes stop_codon:yes gene_type:complete
METKFLLNKTSIQIVEKKIDLFGNFIHHNNISSIFIIVDSNSKKYCLKDFISINSSLANSKVIEINPGEASKSLQVLNQICLQLVNLQIDRNSLIINLGGGVVSDVGGFVASVIKRGVKFINIPTTLMAQIDASIGGKVALNINKYKNQVGLFNDPDKVIIYPDYLKTLPPEDILFAQAEVFKYGLISSQLFWNKITSKKFSISSSLKLIISDCIRMKVDIVNQDYYDYSERRKLNFGHSISHAIESLFFNEFDPISHGLALSAGIICETYISQIRFGFSDSKLYTIVNTLLNHFPYIFIDSKYDVQILDFIHGDKKKSNSSLNFTLIKDIGSAVVNCSVSNEEILSSLEFYRKCRI